MKCPKGEKLDKRKEIEMVTVFSQTPPYEDLSVVLVDHREKRKNGTGIIVVVIVIYIPCIVM